MSGLSKKKSIETVAERRNGTTHIAVSGELDIATISEFETALTTAEDEGPKCIAVDLRDLQFMDSTGLRTILAAQSRSLSAGWQLVVVNGAGPIRRLLKVTGVMDKLTVIDDIEDISELQPS